MTLQSQKSQLRKELFMNRAAAFAGGEHASAAATALLLDHLGDVKGAIISAYRPIRSELNPTNAMHQLYAAGARICVPVIKARDTALGFREWTPESKMVVGAFGAEVPEEGAWLEPEILISPLVGWDRAGWRLGYGGGFYDRSLEALRAKRPTRAIGFAFAIQELKSVPIEPTDQRLDVIVTERELIEMTS